MIKLVNKTQIVDDIKVLLDINDSDEDSVLNIVVNDATNLVETYIGGEADSSLSSIIRQVAMAIYNRIGAEGISNKFEGTTTINFEDILDSYKDTLDAYVRRKSTIRFL